MYNHSPPSVPPLPVKITNTMMNERYLWPYLITNITLTVTVTVSTESICAPVLSLARHAVPTPVLPPITQDVEEEQKHR